MKKLSIREQKRIIEDCKCSGASLADLLTSRGLSYDSLIYEYDSVAPESAGVKFTPVDQRQNVAGGTPCVSFFSGAGGMDIGFECAGFKTLVDVEINPIFCDTLRANGHKNIIGPPSYSGDVNDPDTVIAALKEQGVSRNFKGVFHGGPPCQSFSIAANQRFSKRMKTFKRTGFSHEKYGNLLFQYIRIILHFTPEVFVIENVDGLLTIDGGEQVKMACRMLSKAGYNVAPPKVVNAADYGVPQKRLRTFIIGSRIGEFKFPKPSGQILPAGCAFVCSLEGAENHVTREHNVDSIERYMRLGFGKRDKLGRVDRIDPFRPSKTIIAGGTGGGGRSHLHPYIPRTMSVRECARLQTFPDNFVFTGPVARQFTQVGNAVPPVLAYEIAVAIYKTIYQGSGGVSRVVSGEQPAQDGSETIQLTLFNQACEFRALYLVHESPVTLAGTYRKLCRDWIVTHNLYNYPVTQHDIDIHPELLSVRRLVLGRKNDKPLFFSIKGYSMETRAWLHKRRYPINRKHSSKTQYIVYKLQQIKEDPDFLTGVKPRLIIGKGVKIKTSVPVS